jgi:hypothetical protein
MRDKPDDLAAVAKLMEGYPDHVCDLAWELREFVRVVVPEAVEEIRWKGLCYHNGEGIVKGSICGIGLFEDHVQLGFIHGAFLPDPEGLLEGDRKAKRFINIHSAKDFRKAAIKKLIRAAADFDPRSVEEP